ncbi:hypothetical protein HPB49_003627 [Dermacentor silvarum]|uniref:Uncharacterized protein n=1 Tax=Dermacentor silvarum TaxID=543639 RepID=A0ACB8CPK1_DERSI|nr:hypothetical protein HPB49_003627 [Dermacentor silvarum]
MSLGECITLAKAACPASSKVVGQVEVGTQCSLPLTDKSVGCSFKAGSQSRSVQTVETVDQSSSTSDGTFLAKALFLRNSTELFVGFLTLFQKTEPLLHIFFSEMEVLVKKVLGHFSRREVYQENSGEALKLLGIERLSNWKEHIEIGSNTEAALSDWALDEKKLF